MTVRRAARPKSSSACLAGQTLVAIDFSPRDGQLYALDNAGGLYVMALDAGQQIPVGRIEGALIGSFFGMDFDPADGRLRIVSDTGHALVA